MEIREVRDLHPVAGYSTRMRGRVIARDGRSLVVQNETGVSSVEGDAEVGDLVDDGRVVAAGRGGELRFTRRVLDPRRLRAMAIREAVDDGIRAFFRARGFREVRTDVIVPRPGPEPHITPFAVGAGAWLQTSPELAMKRLLVGGLEKIFQICPVFRDEPSSETHRREFTMLEWYRAYASDEEIQRDTEELVCSLADRVGVEMPRPPWPRLRVRDLFAEHAGVDLVKDDLEAACRRLGIPTDPSDTWDDRYHRIWLGVVEPRLPARPVFVVRYPASQAALARVDADEDGSRWARRFEVYAGGLELGNAFAELTDPVEQRRRLIADGVPIDEGFLAALEEGMPPSGGIAIGVDRLAMLLAGERDIDWLRWL
jgi:lysyl-tRNA synthetase class 2